MTEQEVINIMHEFASLGLTYFSCKDANTELVLKQKPSSAVKAHEETIVSQDAKTNEKAIAVSDAVCIKAPLVGVFYEASSPDAAPFIEVGQHVLKGDTVALIEAMKMMNEVKSPVSGKVQKILAKNGEMVEFDRVLIEIAED